MAKKNKLNSSDPQLPTSTIAAWLEFTGNLLNKIGVAGFIVIVGTTFLILDKERREEFIDTWMLLKHSEIYCVVLILLLALLLLGQQYYNNKITRLKDSEIDRLSEFRNDSHKRDF